MHASDGAAAWLWSASVLLLLECALLSAAQGTEGELAAIVHGQNGYLAGGNRRKTADEIKAEFMMKQLEKFPCDEGCNGHGLCLAIPKQDVPPLEEPTRHGSGCLCDWPPWGGPACGKSCTTFAINYTRSRPMTFEEARQHEVTVLKLNVTYGTNETIPEYSEEYLMEVDVACAGNGLCNPITALCECNYGFAGPACNYHCPRVPASLAKLYTPGYSPFQNKICAGRDRGNCTWSGSKAIAPSDGGSWCHPQFEPCWTSESVYFGARCECRDDLRGHDCSITCPKDLAGRVCSNNGTCTINGECQCNPMLQGSYCQYGILNDTYALWPSLPKMTPRRFTTMTNVRWYWEGWNDEIEVAVHNYEWLGVFFGGVGQAQRNEILVFNPKTREEELELVTQQFSYQEMYYWNHTTKDVDIYTDEPIPRHWDWMRHQCYYEYAGVRVQANCDQDKEAYYVPMKRYGHTIITMGDQKSLMVYGGYSTICADYCNDLWHYSIENRIWTFMNMTTIPSPRYVSQEQYIELYGLFAPPQDMKLTAPVPSKRWQHTMDAVNETALILYGGYFTSNKLFHFLGDIWVYTLNIQPTPENMGRYGENMATWYEMNSTLWGKKPGTANPAGRRAHASCFVNGRLYVHGGQAYDGTYGYDMSGRETKSRSRIKGEMFMYNLAENNWYAIKPASLDGIPHPRYMHASTLFQDSMILHGGYSDPEYYDDMWVFNTTTHSWTHMTYKHRNYLIYNPRPVVRYGHAMTWVGDSFIMFGGYGQVCLNEAIGSPDLDPTNDADEDSTNAFCMPDLVRYPEKDGKMGTAIWYNDITGAISTDASLENAGATRMTTMPLYYGDTWVYNHTRCPEDCSNRGFCHLNFCICQHKMPRTCMSHDCVAPTFWGSFISGRGDANWGFSCRFNACANSSCYYNYTHQTEYCRHCQYHGFCRGENGRCICDKKYQHILPLNYQKKKVSKYGPERNDGTYAMTATPVAFYAEHEEFEFDERRREDCQYSKCPHQFCSGHGYCMKDGRCHCNPEYIGTGCEYHAWCPYKCNYQGNCIPKLRDKTMPWAWSGGGKCACHGVFNGSRCEIVLRNDAPGKAAPSFWGYFLPVISFIVAMSTVEVAVV